MIKHCAICNIILGTHSRGYCREPATCGCYCIEDDGTFPLLTSDPNEYPRFISMERAIAAGALKPYTPAR